MQERVEPPPDRKHQQADCDQTRHAEAMDEMLHLRHQRNFTHGGDGKRGAQRPPRATEIAQKYSEKGIIHPHAHAGERGSRHQRSQSRRGREEAQPQSRRRDRPGALWKQRGDGGRHKRKDGVKRQDQFGIRLRHLPPDHEHRHGESDRAPQPDAPEAAIFCAEVRQRQRRHQRKNSRPHHRHAEHREQERHELSRGPQGHRSGNQPGTGQREQALRLSRSVRQHTPDRLRDDLDHRKHAEHETGLRRGQTAGEQRQRHEGDRGDVHVDDCEKG